MALLSSHHASWWPFAWATGSSDASHAAFEGYGSVPVGTQSSPGGGGGDGGGGGQPMGLTKVAGWVAARWSTRVPQGHLMVSDLVSLGGVICAQAGW